jgi:hypothetical protein
MVKRKSRRARPPKKLKRRYTLADVRGRCSPELADVLEEVRQLMRETLPGVEERIYSEGKGIGYHVRGAGTVCGLFFKPQRLYVVFLYGADMPNAEGLLKGDARQVRWVELRAGEPVPSEALSRIILSAVLK